MALKSFPCTGSSHPVSLFPIDRAECDRKLGEEREQTGRCGGDRMERGRGAELLNFHSRFSERRE